MNHTADDPAGEDPGPPSSQVGEDPAASSPSRESNAFGGSERGSHEHVAVTLGANVFLIALNAGTGVMLARLLGPTGRGQLQAAQIWGMVIATVGALGLPEAVVYFTSRRRDDAPAIVTTAATLGLLSSLVLIVPGWFGVPLLLGAQNEEVRSLAQQFVLAVPILVVSFITVQALRGVGMFRGWNVVRIVPSVGWLVVIVGAWATGRFSIAWLLAGFVVAVAIQLALTIALLLQSSARRVRLEPTRWAPMLGYGLPAMLGTGPQLLNFQLDQWLMAAFMSPDRLGLYVVAASWAGVPVPLLGALGSVLFPRVAGEASEAERARIVLKGFRLGTVMAAIGVTAMLIATYPGMTLLFGSAFEEARNVALVLVVANGFLAVERVVQDGFRGLGRPSEVLWSELVGLACTALLLALLLGPLGIMGAAIASLGGYCVTLVVLLVRLTTTVGEISRRELVPGLDDVRMVLGSIVKMARGEKLGDEGS